MEYYFDNESYIEAIKIPFDTQNNLPQAVRDGLLQHGVTRYIEIKKITNDVRLKEKFIVKIADEYFQSQNYDDAFKTMKEIIHNTQIKDDFYAKLAQAHHQNGGIESIKEIITDILSSSIHEALVSQGEAKAYARIATTKQKACKDYYSDLSTDLYRFTKTKFNDNNEKEAIKIIRKKAKRPQMLKEFLNLN